MGTVRKPCLMVCFAALLSACAAVAGNEGDKVLFTLTLQSGGSVRLPDTLYSVAPRLVVDGTEAIAIGEEVATPEGVRFEFRAPGKGVLATGEATLREELFSHKERKEHKGAAVRWRITLAKDAKKVEWGAVARLPHDEFRREDVSVDGEAAVVRGLRIVGEPPAPRQQKPAPPKLGDETKWWPHHPFWRLSFDGGKAKDAKAGDTFEFGLAFSSTEFKREAHLTPQRGDLSGEAALNGDCESAVGGIAIAFAGPLVVPECGGWVPMDHRKTIVPGSALDFSKIIPRDAPAGKHGWLRGVGDHAEFEGLPGLPQRLYGVNLCDTACYPETPEGAVKLVERLARLGYNSVRIHHHDNALARYEGGVLVPDAEAFDKLDRLVAECVKRGIYLTTDLYVSRRVAWRDVGIDRDGNIPHFKTWQEATERGFRDWCDFARIFLSHVNLYTGRSYADEPAMPFICTQNETCLSGDFKGLWNDPDLDMPGLWAAFLAEARAKNPGAYTGYGPDNPPRLAFPWDESPGDAVVGGFWCWLETRFHRRAERFLREELGSKALLTGDNFGPTPASVLEMRDALYGYCDIHAYPNGWRSWVDFPYSIPIVANTFNPIVGGIGMYEDGLGYQRLWNKPFCVTEWDYVGMNAYRSVAGLAFGSMASIQGWSGVWRFAYDHSRRTLDDSKGAPGLYNLSRDPLALAADRVALLLFLRGDMAEAGEALALDFTDEVLDPAQGRAWRSGPRWPKSDVAWTHRVGAVIRGQGAPDGARVIARDEFEKMGKDSFAASVPSAAPVSIDHERGTFAVATQRTCGVFARGGVHTAGILRVDFSTQRRRDADQDSSFVIRHPSFRGGENAATVFASSLDGAPLAESRRILVTHLTDCRAKGFATTDELGTIILRWRGDNNPDGTTSLYLKEGVAEIELALSTNDNNSVANVQVLPIASSQSPIGKCDLDLDIGNNGNNPFRVWALATDGKRECEVPCAFDPATGRLRFTASVRQPFGGCMCYEIVRGTTDTAAPAPHR